MQIVFDKWIFGYSEREKRKKPKVCDNGDGKSIGIKCEYLLREIDSNK